MIYYNNDIHFIQENEYFIKIKELKNNLEFLSYNL